MYALQIGTTGFFVTPERGISRDLRKICRFDSTKMAQKAWLTLDWSGLKISPTPNQIAAPKPAQVNFEMPVVAAAAG